MTACPVCSSEGYDVDRINGTEYCTKRNCTVNERPCRFCDFTGYTVERDIKTGEPTRVVCQHCDGQGFVFAADVSVEAW